MNNTNILLITGVLLLVFLLLKESKESFHQPPATIKLVNKTLYDLKFIFGTDSTLSQVPPIPTSINNLKPNDYVYTNFGGFRLYSGDPIHIGVINSDTHKGLALFGNVSSSKITPVYITETPQPSLTLLSSSIMDGKKFYLYQ